MADKIPLTEKARAQWQERIEAGEKYIERHTKTWKERQAAYAGQPLRDVPSVPAAIINKDLPRTKQKSAQLFYQLPEIHAKPKRPEFRMAAPVHAAVINHKLSYEIKAHYMVDEVLTDVVAVSGIGVSKVGYEAVTSDVDVPVVDPYQAAELQAQGFEVPTEKVPVPIYESYFWKRISPAKLLLPPEFVGTDFDEASWIGFKFRMTADAVKRTYRKDVPGEIEDESTVTDLALRSEEKVEKEVECVEIWYKASLFDPKEKHPLKQRRMVFVGDETTPVVHEDSPYQQFDEQGRFLTGMKRYPIRVLTLTTIPDEAIPPADTQIAAPLVGELQEGRTQMIRQRRLSQPLRWINVAAVEAETAEKVLNGEIQDVIPLNAPGDTALGEVARANYPRENFEFNRIVEQDLDEVWSLGSNQMGNDSPGEMSATESQIIQGNANVRLDYERAKVMRWFLQGAECLGDLIQLFADDQDYVEIVGPDRARQLVAWNRRTIAGEFVYSARTNSQLRLDVAQERLDTRNAYQLLANDPYVNRQKLVEKIAETHDLDATEFLVQPPPKQPEPPNVSFRFSGDDLNPLNPSFPIVLQVLAAGGFQVPPEVIDQAKVQAAMMMATGGTPNVPTASPSPPLQTEHGGPAQQAEPLSKHQLTRGDGR